MVKVHLSSSLQMTNRVAIMFYMAQQRSRKGERSSASVNLVPSSLLWCANGRNCAHKLGHLDSGSLELTRET